MIIHVEQNKDIYYHLYKINIMGQSKYAWHLTNHVFILQPVY
jgi:hypothetical protein